MRGRAVQLFKLRQAEKGRGFAESVAHGPRRGGQAIVWASPFAGDLGLAKVNY
jgi:hypothetical protein